MADTLKTLFAAFKKAAPAADIAFVRAIASPALQAHIDSLVKPKASDAKYVTCMWRMERAKRDGWPVDVRNAEPSESEAA